MNFYEGILLLLFFQIFEIFIHSLVLIYLIDSYIIHSFVHSIHLQGGHHPVSSTVGIGHPSGYGGLGPSSLGGSLHDTMADGIAPEKAPPSSSSNCHPDS